MMLLLAQGCKPSKAPEHSTGLERGACLRRFEPAGLLTHNAIRPREWWSMGAET